MGKFTYCDDCLEDNQSKDATHFDVLMWNGTRRDLCDDCFEWRKEHGDLKTELGDKSTEEKK